MKRWVAIGFLSVISLFLLIVELGTIDELLTTQANLNLLKTKLDETFSNYNQLISQLNDKSLELFITQNKLSAKQEELGILNNKLADLQTNYDVLVSGHTYNIKDPTYKQMMDFLKEDVTDQRQYILGDYDCDHFAMDVCNSAEENGIRCAFVTIDHPVVAHAIVAFNTVDKGLVYVEPQDDNIVVPVVGKHYYQCIIPEPGHYYEQPTYDDTIIRIIVVW